MVGKFCAVGKRRGPNEEIYVDRNDFVGFKFQSVYTRAEDGITWERYHRFRIRRYSYQNVGRFLLSETRCRGKLFKRGFVRALTSSILLDVFKPSKTRSITSPIIPSQFLKLPSCSSLHLSLIDGRCEIVRSRDLLRRVIGHFAESQVTKSQEKKKKR